MGAFATTSKELIYYEPVKDWERAKEMKEKSMKNWPKIGKKK